MLITVTVRTFTGKSISLGVDPTDTVSHLKKLLSNKNGPGSSFRIPAQNIGYKGHELRDYRRLSHYNIDTGDTLNICEYVCFDPDMVQMSSLKRHSTTIS
jgi:Ubiquitin family